MSAGRAGVKDYELLELVLFRSIPQKDVKELAKNLIATFGSFADVLAASPARLRSVKGIGDAVITDLKVIQAAALELAQGNVLHREVLSSWDQLVTYCRSACAYEKIEQFRILFLDNRNVLIADEKQQSGTINHTPVYPREVVKRALELDAAAIILVHNHPSGDPTPSRADIDMTRRIIDATGAVGIKVHDHLVIGRGKETSFRSLGLI